MTKIIYIGGYGHSGSTLLEYLIAGSSEILACGEVASVLRTRNKKKCTCGYGPEECCVWGLFHSNSCHRPKTHSQLLGALVRYVQGRYAGVVDSSKTAWGALSSPFRLRHTFGDDFLLVHLTRQPTGACWSVVRRKSSKAKRARRWLYSEKLGCAWTSFGWSMANLSCELFRLIYPRQYVHLRYEDLVRAPVEVVQVLLTRAAPGLCWDGKFSGSNNRHQLYGNTVRYRPPSIENIEEDLRWKNEMPPDHARLILHLTSLLRSRYGY